MAATTSAANAPGSSRAHGSPARRGEELIAAGLLMLAEPADLGRAGQVAMCWLGTLAWGVSAYPDSED
jgi:hypothetical protein